MSQKPRLEVDNKGIPNLVSDPLCYDGKEESYSIPGTVTSMKPETNKKLDPKCVTGPKTFGN